jgi:hypothetical protein
MPIKTESNRIPGSASGINPVTGELQLSVKSFPTEKSKRRNELALEPRSKEYSKGGITCCAPNC